MGIEGEKSRGTFGSYLDCADEILGIAAGRSKAQFEVISRNHGLRSESPSDLHWVDLHRVFTLATQI